MQEEKPLNKPRQKPSEWKSSTVGLKPKMSLVNGITVIVGTIIGKRFIISDLRILLSNSTH